jgi:allophanate hydrolase subunit 1
MFDAAREPPSLLQAGDRIVFVPITERVFEQLAAEQAAR